MGGCASRQSVLTPVQPDEDPVGKRVNVNEGDNLKTLERALADVEKELSSAKLDTPRRDYLAGEVPKLRAMAEDRRKLEGAIVSPKARMVTATPGQVPKTYLPAPEDAVEEYNALAQTIREARSTAQEGGVYGEEDRLKLETRLAVVEAVASAKQRLADVLELSRGLSLRWGKAQLGVLSAELQETLGAAEAQARVLEEQEAMDRNIDRKKLLKKLEAHVAALPEFLEAQKRTDQLERLTGAKERLAEATREAYALGREESCADLEGRMGSLGEHTLHLKGTSIEFAPVSTEEKALKQRLLTLRALLAAKVELVPKADEPSVVAKSAQQIRVLTIARLQSLQQAAMKANAFGGAEANA
eukprot:1034570-Prymnesium_polylepis.1